MKSLAELSTGNYDGGLGQKLLFGFGLIMTVVATVFITHIAQKSLRDALPANTPTENHEAQHSSDQPPPDGDPPVV